jgi:hypothetical protein
MKKLFIVLIIFFGISIAPHRAQAQQVSVSFQVFYDQMSPYGSWVNYQNYGYVWIPTAVPSGFRPYATGGHWIYTDDGWTWVSDYTWGWAAFHYGNWFYDQSYGWMWLPDYQWAPAWVTWGQYEDNYCWAPIGPRINIGVSYASYRPPSYYWTFVPRTYMTNVNINRYYVNRVNNTTVINNITVINNVNRGASGNRNAFMRGPQPKTVERYTHNTVHTVQIRETSSPGRGQIQNGQLAIYRPAINRSDASKPAPAKVGDMHRIQTNTLPATNSHVQSNNAKNINASNKIQESSNRTPNNTPVNKKTVVNSPENNNSAPSAPHENVDKSRPPNSNVKAPREFNSEKNKPVMKPSPEYKHVSPPAANKVVNPPPVQSNNHPVIKPANSRPNSANQHPVQQPRQQHAPPNHQPPPPVHNSPQPKQDEHHK